MTDTVVTRTSSADMLRSREWTGRFLEGGGPPISFRYGGREMHGIPAAWNPVERRRRIDANLVETVFEARDPATGLEVRIEAWRYLDFPVVEWTAWFTNRGAGPTPLLEDIQAIDTAFDGSAPVLYHCNGDFYSETGYEPTLTQLAGGQEVAVAPSGGRPCDQAFPYFRLLFEHAGITLAVGWPGQWSARFTGRAGGAGVVAGQELTHLRLHPGEAVRTPRITILSWSGDEARGVNLWRRWYLAHVLPRPDGSPLAPVLSAAGTDDAEEFTGATEENQLGYIDRFREHGVDFDVWWIDAGWYPCTDPEGNRRWVRTGTWEPDPDRFPHGLAPVSKRVERDGGRLLLWFEPERVTRGSALDREHPEWLLHIAGPDDEAESVVTSSRLLNLGDPACRRWLTDHVCRLIEENGIGVYRQDFNFRPLPRWRDNDAEDRQGMGENLHVQGYLRFWDDLLERNPGLWIDSCSSGGRRNDLETMRRSVPLHYTDYGYGFHEIKLAFHHTLHQWIPYFRESTLSWDEGESRHNQSVDSFSFHCAMAGMLSLAVDIKKDGWDWDLIRRMIEVWRRAAPHLVYGDHYALTPFSKSRRQWVVAQFDTPERGEGYIQAIRHRDSPDGRFTAHPQGLRPEAAYMLEEGETGRTWTATGRELMEDGATFELPPRTGSIWFYRRRGGEGAATDG